MYSIYSIRNRINQRAYIGSTIDLKRRFKEYRFRLRNGTHSNFVLQAAWNKYGEESFLFEEIRTLSSIEELVNTEDEIINELKKNIHVYNIRVVADSNKNHKHSEETKLKISLSLKGRNTLSNDARKRQSETIRGRKKPFHVIKAMHEAATLWRSNALNIENMARKNSKLSDNDIRDIRISRDKYPILSEKYNVSKALICLIKQNKSYKWVN